MLAIWSLVPLPFLKPAWTSGSSQSTYCWSLAWRILSITSMWTIGEGNGNPLQCSCLENPRDRGAWWLPSMGLYRVGHDGSDLAAAACERSAIVQYFEHSLALPFFGIGMKTDLFQSCGHCWVFQICWHIECSTFTASSFRIWNSSTGIPSPSLALFVVMLPKAHLTSHSRMSGLGEWSHHCDHLGHEDLFCIVLPCILATSS